jgi:hypothetical protein
VVGHLPHWALSSAPPLKKKNGLLPQSQGPRTCIEKNEFNIEKTFKKQNLLLSILKLMLYLNV